MTLPQRIVTGVDVDGRSTVASAEELPVIDFTHTPGFATRVVATMPPAITPAANARRPDPAGGGIVPQPGGATFVVITFPPDAVMSAPDFDGAAAGQEMLQRLPGFAELFEADAPGMHTTPTIDYGIVTSGELWLELGDGSLTHLRAGDVIVQNSTRHAWRNMSDHPATLAVVLVGAPTA